MIDQATELRRLVLKAMRENPVTVGPPPRLLVLTGAKSGVGVTSIAVNLAVALSQQGSRVVLVDADPHRSDVATLCGIRQLASCDDLALATRDVHEMLQLGPAGIQIVPGLNSQEALNNSYVLTDERFHRQLLTLGHHADVVVFDVGCADNDLTGRFCQSASDVLLLTTPDDATVMDAYARVKTMLAEAKHPDLHVLINHSDDLAHAQDVHRRLDDSCLRFLDRRIGFAGHVPHDDRVSKAAINGKPFLLRDPQAGCSQAVHQLATCLTLVDSASRAD